MHRVLGDVEWEGINAKQQEFLAWYTAHRDEIRKLGDLEALASTDFTELNSFLTGRGFDPMFGPFTGIGVAAILDMLIEWANKGTLTTITRWKQSGAVDYLRMQSGTDYPGSKSPQPYRHLRSGYRIPAPAHPVTHQNRTQPMADERERTRLRTGTEPSGPVPDDHAA